MADLGRELCHAVTAAAAAGMGRFFTQQAGPRRAAKLFPGNLAAVRPDDINIEQAAKAVLVFQSDHQCLDEFRICVYAVERLISGFFL